MSQFHAGDEHGVLLEIDRLQRHFGSGPNAIRAVDGLSLSVKAGEIVSILGPSGCGKTTTMRIIAGLERADSGDVRVRGTSVMHHPPHVRNFGLVFQSLAVFPHMSVAQNVSFGLRMRGVDRNTIARRVGEALSLVQLDPRQYQHRMPAQLSGGQLQRVALARTLVTEPDVVLFDEPMAALDRRLRDYMAMELRAIQKRLNVASIYVTHDQETASLMSDRIVIMNQGQIVQIGSPIEVYQNPRNHFVANFLGDANCLKGTTEVTEEGENGVACALGSFKTTAVDFDADKSVTVMVRPEQITFIKSNGPTKFPAGTVRQLDFVSGIYRYTIELEDGTEILVKKSSESEEHFSPGTKIRLKVNAESVPAWVQTGN